MTKHRHSKYQKPTVRRRINWLAIIAVAEFVIAVGMVIYTLAVQQPINNEFAVLKHDYPMIEDIAEANKIAKTIQVPEPVGSYKNLDYSVIAVFKTTPNTPPESFRDAAFGYILSLKTNNHSYVGIDSSDNSSRKNIIFTVR